MHYDKKIESEVIKDSNYYVGNTMLTKSRFNMPQQMPIEKHVTEMPHDHDRAMGDQPEAPAPAMPPVASPELKEPNAKPNMLGKSEDGMHRHYGHTDAHPMRLRHRKVSADPLHKEEDGLLDEWHDLYDKAKAGQCTAEELARIQQIRGKIDEIASTRSTDAENILGIAMKALNKAEAFQVKEKDLKDSNDTSWQGREAEYGDPDPDEILPKNNGYRDQVDREESVWGSLPDDERVFSTSPDVVENKALRKAAQVSQNVINYFNKEWGTLQVKGDDGRFSDPLYYAKYAEAISKSLVDDEEVDEGGPGSGRRPTGVAETQEGWLQQQGMKKPKTSPLKNPLQKHDLPNSPHTLHMSNGGGWGVKLNQATGNFVAYQRDDGSLSKRDAQRQALDRNQKNKAESKGNDDLQMGVDLNKINEQLLEALKPLDNMPLYKEPRMRP